MMTKKLIALLMAGAVAASGWPEPAHAESTLDVVKKNGVVRAGVRKDVANFGFTNEKGEIVGFDVDIAKGIAEKLGVKIELVPVTSATRVPLLHQGRIDFIAATMTQYRSREGAVDFSIPYFYTPQTLLVKKGSGIKTMADLAGKRAGSALGAGAVKNMQAVQPKVTVQTFQSYPEAFIALQQGLIDAIGTDVTILASLRGNAANPNDFELVPGATYGGGHYAIAVRHDDTKWRTAINHALQDMWKDGTWDKIYARWVGPGTKLNIKKEELPFTMPLWN
jgi:polar amino acid transport system substrate-binding protein